MEIERAAERIRHDLKFRVGEVSKVERLTPRMVRVTLQSPDLRTFRSDAYDDHVKLFFPAPGEALVVPTPGPNGMVFPEGVARPEARDYTPRAFDTEHGELVIDFVLHGEGPASNWAANAKPGDRLGIGGPRASFVVRDIFDWYLLVGDETALPAIGRRIEELPDHTRVLAFIEIADLAERQVFSERAGLQIHWVPRGPAGQPLLQAISAAALPTSNGYAFVAGEAEMAAAVRTHLVKERGLDPWCVKASGYWRKGEGDFYDGHAH